MTCAMNDRSPSASILASVHSPVIVGQATAIRNAGRAIPGRPSSLACWAGSQITSLVRLLASRISMAGLAKAVNSGTYTAPRRQIANSVTR
ncbi:hypothetical protein D3C87_1285500 [compost metagenome]